MRVFLVLLIASLFFGCGRQDPQGSENTEEERPLNMLLVGDPFALALKKCLPELEERSGLNLDIEIVGYNDVRRMSLQNRQDRVSRYDLVSFDIVWMGEYEQQSLLLPLEEKIQLDQLQLLKGSLSPCSRSHHCFGLPIQPHSELLWVRQDLLDAHGLRAPRNTDELLAVAKQLHNPEEQLYGINWNAQRGQPLGQSMAHFFASFGQPLLNEQGKAAFNTEKGLAAARYALALCEVSPPDIYNIAWAQRTRRFASGRAAMTYGWGGRASVAEEDPSSVVAGKVLYLPPPHAPDAEPVTPLGVWALGIPANAPNPEASVKLLEAIYSPEFQKILTLAGNAGPPRLDTLKDPELQQKLPVFALMASTELQAQLSAEMRPPIPEWNGICQTLGTVFHEMLLGALTPEQALAEAELRVNNLLSTDAQISHP